MQRNLRGLSLIIGLFAALNFGFAQELKIVTKKGEEINMKYVKNRVKNKGVEVRRGIFVEYRDMEYIGTSDIDAFERVMRKAGTKRNKHLNIDFTGNEDVYALRLQKLRENRTKANLASGAGGLMMIIGTLSGDRDLYAVGAATLGAGIVAKSINEQNTLETQNQAIMANQREMMAKDKEEAEVDALRKEFGQETVDGLISLIDGNHERALAFANVADTSFDANHRVGAAWLKALIYADSEQTELLQEEYERLVILDREVNSVAQAEKYMEELLEELNTFRQG